MTVNQLKNADDLALKNGDVPSFFVCLPRPIVGAAFLVELLPTQMDAFGTTRWFRYAGHGWSYQKRWCF